MICTDLYIMYSIVKYYVLALWMSFWIVIYVILKLGYCSLKFCTDQNCFNYLFKWSWAHIWVHCEKSSFSKANSAEMGSMPSLYDTWCITVILDQNNAIYSQTKQRMPMMYAVTITFSVTAAMLDWYMLKICIFCTHSPNYTVLKLLF